MASGSAIQVEKDRIEEAIGSPYISLERFLGSYAEVEDGYKYEWNDGKVEKWEKTNQEQTVTFFLLSRLFNKTKMYQEGGGLTAETDMMTTDKQLRRPDLAIFTGEQIKKMSSENQIAPWVAEVISGSDNINKVEEKSDEYFAAGVQVVWRIFPSARKVVVYTTNSIKECRGSDICSGAPVLDDFEISADEIFASFKEVKS
ncbi:MAG: Uma2 family endonuclease [Bacteroidota bacterium]